MHRVFRLRHLLSAAALLAVGLLPVSAFQSLGDADNFAVLASTVDTTLAEGIVRSAGPGTGNVGAVNFNPDPPRITTPGTVANDIAPSVIADLRNRRLALVQQAQTASDPTEGTRRFDGKVLTPGVYRIPVKAATPRAFLDTDATLTLDGDGDYLFVIDAPDGVEGLLDFGTRSKVELINGADPANIIWVADKIRVGNNARVQGRLLSGGDIHLRGTNPNDPNANVITGKLFAEGRIHGDNQTWILQDVIVGTRINVTNVTGGTGAGTPANPLVVAPGGTLTFRVRAEGQNPLTLTHVGNLPANYTETPNNTDPNSPFIDVRFQPTEAQRGLVSVTYRASDNQGTTVERQVVILVDTTTSGILIGNITGGHGGTGTANDPIRVCETETLTFDVAATNAEGGNVTLSATNVPANLTFNPTLPRTDANNVDTRVTFNPNDTQAGTFTVTFTARDANGDVIGTRDVTIEVDNVPDFVAPTPAEASVFTVRPGQTVSYTIRAIQSNGAALRAEVSGTGPRTTAAGVPLGAVHTPNENGDDVAGPIAGGDVLIGAGTPATSDAQIQFNWTPTAADVGTYRLTYAVSDINCNVPVFRTIIIDVTTAGQARTLSIERTGVPVVGEQVCYTATVRDENNNPVAGVPVRFLFSGTAGITGARDQVATTDANGRARVCVTLTSEGSLSVRAFVDTNGDGQPDGPTVEDREDVNVVLSGGRTSVTGRGWVSAPAFNGDAQFGVSVTSRRRPTQRPRGGVTFSIIGASPIDGSPVLISGKSQRIDTLVSFESDRGVEAEMTGVFQLRAGRRSRTRVNGIVRVLDAATPGVPADRFEFTALNPDGTPNPGLSFGGNLKFFRNTNAKANDIQIRTMR